jgi:RNA polymerase sigma factor (sigma-70 family)
MRLRMRRAMRRSKPDRKDLFRAAVELVSTGSGAFKSTARRYSLCSADAEDAYQRSLEILITSAPTPERAQLTPWLHTVIKHEALAIRRQRERLLGDDCSQLEPSTNGAGRSPEEEAPERERARRTAEALSQLKPNEVQCLLLKAVGYSYDEISLKTGFSWTKVNRSLSEGRKRFFDHFAQIESGQRCGRFRSLLSAACDGEASPDEESRLRTHLRACPSCRAALRNYRELPAHVSEVLPPVVLLPALCQEGWWSRLHDSVVVWIGERGAVIGHKLQQAGEALSAQKATAVVASTAALTGGAVVHQRAVSDHASHKHEHSSLPADRAATARTGGPTSPPAVARALQPTRAYAAQPNSTKRRASKATGEFSPEQVGSTAASTKAVEIADTAGGRSTAKASRTSSARASTGQEFGP